MRAAVIKAALAELHVLEAQYSTADAFQWVATSDAYCLTTDEIAVLARAINHPEFAAEAQS